MRETAEQCPRCGSPGLLASPRNTVRVCQGCRAKVTPAGVLAPYERGGADTARQVKTQREADLEALELAGRKGVMLGELRGVAAAGNLDDASALKVEWFAEQVKAAASGARLDQLAERWREAGMRRRRFWQARPAAITAGYPGDIEDDYAGYDEDDYGDDGQGEEAAPLVLATPASIAARQDRAQQPATWAEALAALGWRLYPLAQWDGCQVVTADGNRCADPQTRHHVGAGWACSPHYAALTDTIGAINKERGIR